MVWERLHGPLGPERADWNAALVAASVANSLSSKKSKRKKLADFVIDWGGGAAKQRKTPEQLLAAAKGWVQRAGGVIR